MRIRLSGVPPFGPLKASFPLMAHDCVHGRGPSYKAPLYLRDYYYSKHLVCLARSHIHKLFEIGMQITRIIKKIKIKM